MTIKERIEAVQAKIESERTAAGGGASKTANDLQTLAAAAILGGDKEIKAYMEMFTTDPTEIAKLMPDNTKPFGEGKNLARAYLMGNGPCGSQSPAGPGLGLLFGVSGLLDEA